jgi:hypothetical protein
MDDCLIAFPDNEALMPSSSRAIWLDCDMPASVTCKRSSIVNVPGLPQKFAQESLRRASIAQVSLVCYTQHCNERRQD